MAHMRKSRPNSSPESESLLKDIFDTSDSQPRRRRTCSSFTCFTKNMFSSFVRLFSKPQPCRRVIHFPESFRTGVSTNSRYPVNAVYNQKYSILSFVPVVLYEQFKYFYNLYFLCVALSQFIPLLKIGSIVTYFAPLIFVLFVTMLKEALEDLKRRRRDIEVNSQLVDILDPYTLAQKTVSSSSLHVGDLVIIKKDQRLPADLLILRSSAKNGTCFIRTDQLDGETDWKLKIAVPCTQELASDKEICSFPAYLEAEPPSLGIHSFFGSLTNIIDNEITPLTADNMLWMNTVLASDTIIGIVVYTGKDTRAVMNTGKSVMKFGLLDSEVNDITKILCFVTVFLSASMVVLSRLTDVKQGVVLFVRFMILFSSIIPISLRVNLEVGKVAYAYFIKSDKEIPDTIVRNSKIPEELGRVQVLLTDKTGTLTKNEMELKKLHIGTMSFNSESFDEISDLIVQTFKSKEDKTRRSSSVNLRDPLRGTGSLGSRVHEVLMAIALCHNVNPITDSNDKIQYEAASPDETALVNWAHSMKVSLFRRELHSMQILVADSYVMDFNILQVFPFTSERKRMGIIVQDQKSKEIVFYEKGADIVMCNFVQFNDWLVEECDNMAREGLRTLVIARKRLKEETYEAFARDLKAAKSSFVMQQEQVSRVISQYLESDMELLGLTGVEDKLQDDVRSTLELLRNAGIRIWMLTGDKIETAKSIALSSKLVPRKMRFCDLSSEIVKTNRDAQSFIELYDTYTDGCLIVDGIALAICLEYCREQFLALATKLSTVVCCRCSPTQKAQVTLLIKQKAKLRVACIGDGGNDVGMIVSANVGIGIVGKEGRQASLAADFSITKFSHVGRLLLWHGRNSYKRSAKLSQVIMHRGLAFSIMQAVFSSVFYYAPIAIFQGWLLIGYTTIYTNAPLFFPIVWDTDVTPEIAMMFPELYKDLVSGKYLSAKTFFIWMFISIYQGVAIMLGALFFFTRDFYRIISISFTALILNEWIIYALEIVSWSRVAFLSFFFAVMCYFLSWLWVPEFDAAFMVSLPFLWKVLAITALAAIPLILVKKIKQFLSPPSYQKLVNHH